MTDHSYKLRSLGPATRGPDALDMDHVNAKKQLKCQVSYNTSNLSCPFIFVGVIQVSISSTAKIYIDIDILEITKYYERYQPKNFKYKSCPFTKHTNQDDYCSQLQMGHSKAVTTT
jgi:hypothetical protein